MSKKRSESRWSTKRIAFLGLGFLLAAAVSFGAIRLFNAVDERYPWLWSYGIDQMFPPKDHPVKGPKHIMFLFTCHFEPHDQKTMERWMEHYPKMALRHQDSDGRHPQRSWFWYFSQSDDGEKLSFLQQLSKLVYQGFGEVELHLHHANDDEKTFLGKVNHMIQLSQQTGAMITWEAHPRTAFGFIHGMWGLDNSRGPGACGINNELILLRKLNCYADFTHPSWGPMHPRIVNRLYYATDDPNRPKSYDQGKEMRAGVPGIGDLLIFEGPSVVRFSGLKPTYDHGEISLKDLPLPARIDDWIKAGVHVRGRPEWIFVKVFAHGALEEDHEAVLGKWADKMHSYLEQNYNDGGNYVLHYVTAREAYNIALAAEAEKSGNPNDFRDFTLPPYVNRFMIASVPYEAISMDDKKAVLKFLTQPESKVEVHLRAKEVRVSGDALVEKTQELQDETVLTLTTKGQGLVGMTFREPEAGDVGQGSIRR